MSIFDRRPPAPTKQPRRFTCEHCAFFSYDPDTALGHMFAAHINRRIASVAPHPGRRLGDRTGLSPVVQRFMAAAERGEGLGRRSRVS